MSTSATLSAASSVVREVPLRQDATVIGLVGLAHASSHFGHLLLPLLFPVFMKEFGLSFAELGFLMTVFFVVSGTGQATAGFVLDALEQALHARHPIDGDLVHHSDSKSFLASVAGRPDPHSDGPVSVVGAARRLVAV